MSIPVTPDYLVQESGFWDGESQEDYDILYSLAYNLLQEDPTTTPASFEQFLINYFDL